MLKDRLRSSAILIAVIAALLYLDGNHPWRGSEGLWLLPLLLFFSLGTAFDIATLLSSSNRRVSRWTTLLATAVVTLSACVPLVMELIEGSYPANCPLGRLGWIVIGSITAVFLVLGREMWSYGRGTQGVAGMPDGVADGALERSVHGIFVALYVGLPLALLVALRQLGSGNWGLAAVLTTIAVTKSADAGAYFTGKSIGRHKLIPRLSPGKTWEGAAGGILTAMLVAYVCLRWLFPAVSGTGSPPGATPAIAMLAHPLWGAIALGLLLAGSGMIGDLAESLVKRECGAKDSGTWLPGLGGVWDVTDSLIAAVLPAFLCFAAGVAG